jgi:hypothetical protein
LTDPGLGCGETPEQRDSKYNASQGLNFGRHRNNALSLCDSLSSIR